MAPIDPIAYVTFSHPFRIELEVIVSTSLACATRFVTSFAGFAPLLAEISLHLLCGLLKLAVEKLLSRQKSMAYPRATTLIKGAAMRVVPRTFQSCTVQGSSGYAIGSTVSFGPSSAGRRCGSPVVAPRLRPGLGVFV
jgi:hypothetical protein